MEDLTNAQYIARMQKLVKERQGNILADRQSKKLGFLGEKNLNSQKAGVKPIKTKTSTRESHNPLVLTLCHKTLQKVITLYLDIADLYKEASYKFRNRIKGYKFPVNTYMPPCCIA